MPYNPHTKQQDEFPILCRNAYEDDGSGFTTHPDGTVTQLTAEEVMLSLGSVTAWGTEIPAEQVILAGPTADGRTASLEEIIATKEGRGHR